MKEWLKYMWSNGYITAFVIALVFLIIFAQSYDPLQKIAWIILICIPICIMTVIITWGVKKWKELKNK